MVSRKNCGSGVESGAAAVSDSRYSVGAAENHDPIATLIARIREAAERGEPLAAGARVRVRKVAGGAYRVEREAGR